MSIRTVSEKDLFLAAFQREAHTTLRVLLAYPPEKSELKPAEKSKNARELAWMLVLNQSVITPVLAADLKPGAFPKPPGTWAELIQAFEREHRAAIDKLEDADETSLGRSFPFPTGPKQMGEMKVGDALWYFLHDTIHHRGQLTVYSRLAGGTVPSIYGPTADEPWF
jgi:uncharacterized damage-inducible protein DinB